MSRAFSLMERAPWYVIYALHIPYGLWLALRYGGVSLPSMSNPALDASGLTRESKSELFNLLGPLGRAHLPAFVTIMTGPEMMADAARAMAEKNLAWPVVVKPD